MSHVPCSVYTVLPCRLYFVFVNYTIGTGQFPVNYNLLLLNGCVCVCVYTVYVKIC